jgi:golgin subfamily B member 1
MAEGNEKPGGEPTDRRSIGGSEGDLLAERRARRASETGEAALTRRAEAAEATVRTLEVHVATLRERMREVEEERRGHAERAEAGRAAVLEREAELRRVKQREYAEQQLRVEAEDRLMSIDRESRAQIDRLNRRLSVSEREARELAQRLESVQRALAEAEQAAAAERTAVRRSERELQARLTELECRALEINQVLAAERAARERCERMLESIRRGHRMVESLVGDTRAIVARLAAAFAGAQQDAATLPPQAPGAETPAPRKPAEGHVPGVPESGIAAAARSAEMAGALAAAVERLRARAEEHVADGMREAAATASGRGALAVEAPATVSATPAPRAERPPVSRPVPSARPPVPLPAAAQVPRVRAPKLPRHKHSLSLIGRWRIRRKQRRRR